MAITEHPVARIFPDMPSRDYYDLERDIEAHGLKVPILLWHGQLVDGRHRLKACDVLGIEPRFQELDCDEFELPTLVWSLNGLRRQLTASQRAMSAVIFLELSKKINPKQLEKLSETDTFVSTETGTNVQGAEDVCSQRQAAKQVNVSYTHVQRAATVYREDQSLAHQVYKGEISVGKALKEIDERQDPTRIEPSRDQPNAVHRDHLRQALDLCGRLEELVQMITRYSRPPVPDEVAWGREVELKQQLTALCAMIPKLCINEVGASWNEAQAAEGAAQRHCA